MPLPKGHHFVPEVLLKRFVDESGWLFFARRAEPGAVRPTRINKAFKQSHLYNQLSDEGEKDPTVEIELSSLESRVDPIIDELIDAARAERLPTLTAEEADVWYRFFIVQWKRVPDLHADIASDEITRGMLEEINAELRSAFPEKAGEIDALSTPDEIDRMIRNTRIRAILQITPRILELFRARGICVIRHRLPRKSFVIGSRPVIQMGFREGKTLFDTATEMWLPVSSDVIVGVGRGRPLELRFFDNERPIRTLNQGVVQSSSSFGCSSVKLARSLAQAVWPSWSSWQQ